MKKTNKILCLFTAAIISISAFASTVNVSSYYEISKVYKNTGYYHDEPKIQVGNISYVFKKNVEYNEITIPYSATVVGIPNIAKVEIPKKVLYDGIEFTVTDLDLYGDYKLAKNKTELIQNKFTCVEEIILPDTIYNITEFGCFPNLKKVNIPKNTVIGRYSMENLIYDDKDSNLEESENYSYFRDCPKLKLTVDSNNPYYSYKNDMLLSKNGERLYMSFNSNSEVIIPDGVVFIFNDGGYGFKNVKKIILPATLRFIRDVYFPKLKEIRFPDNYKEIGYREFYKSGIKSIKFSKKATYIGHEAFSKCENLKSVTTPKRLKRIENYAFKACTELKSVKILSSKSSIGISTFEKCRSLKSVLINGAVFIDNKAFYNCKKLSKVTLKNKKSVPGIGRNAFKNTKKGIRFYVKNNKVAKSLKNRLHGSGVRNAKIIIGKRVIYKNIN